MIIVQNIIVDEDLLEEEFACNLTACHGACCVSGDGGAPLEAEETEILDAIQKQIRPYLTEEGKAVLNEKGNWTQTLSQGINYLETPLHGKRGACAYAIFENDIALCGIEKAWKAGATDFRKPISCHLYPIRVEKQNNGMQMLQYHRWAVCNPACVNGKKIGMPVYKFLKEAIIRAYGQDFYNELDEIATAWLENK